MDPQDVTIPNRSKRMEGVQSPIIPEVRQLIAEHPGTISLGQGMVAFGPPASVQAAVTERWQDVASHYYGAVQGEAALVQGLTDQLQRDHGIVLDERHWLMVTAGSNMAFLQVILAITDPGDEVILLTPFYFNHQMALGIAGCRSVEVPTDDRHQPSVEAIEAAMGPRTRAVVTVSPNNPTGAVYGGDVLRRINDLCRGRGIYHLHDEAYAAFLWDGAEHVSPMIFDGAASHTVALYSFSKAYGMAGWRVGYAVVPAHLRGALLKVQDTNLICPPRWSQWAALAALQDANYCSRQLEPLKEARRRLLDGLRGLGPALRQGPLELDRDGRLGTGQGAMYVWIEAATSAAGGRSGRQLNEQLVKGFGIAGLPGETFGAADRTALRISFGGLPAEQAEEGVDRLIRGLGELLDNSFWTFSGRTVRVLDDPASEQAFSK